MERPASVHLFSAPPPICAIGASGGYIFLGVADHADAAPKLFRPIDREGSSIQGSADRGTRCAWFARVCIGSSSGISAARPPAANAHLSALERQSPPSALIDADYRVLHLSPNAGRFIRPSEGPLGTGLLQLICPELRLELKLALQRAFEVKEAALTPPISVETAGKRRCIMAYVSLTEADDGVPPLALVIFLDAGAAGAVEEAGNASAWQGKENRRLTQEVVRLQEHLNASKKQYAELPARLAETLVARRIPFVTVTGYGNRQFDIPALQAAPRLNKPVNKQDLIQVLSDFLCVAD